MTDAIRDRVAEARDRLESAVLWALEAGMTPKDIKDEVEYAIETADD